MSLRGALPPPSPAVHRGPAAPGAHAGERGRLTHGGSVLPGADRSKASETEFPPLLQGQSLGVQRGAGQPSSCFPVGEPFREAAFSPECQGRPLPEAQTWHGEAEARPRAACGGQTPPGLGDDRVPSGEGWGQYQTAFLRDATSMPPSHVAFSLRAPDTAFTEGVSVTSLLYPTEGCVTPTGRSRRPTRAHSAAALRSQKADRRGRHAGSEPECRGRRPAPDEASLRCPA